MPKHSVELRGTPGKFDKPLSEQMLKTTVYCELCSYLPDLASRFDCHIWTDSYFLNYLERSKHPTNYLLVTEIFTNKKLPEKLLNLQNHWHPENLSNFHLFF